MMALQNLKAAKAFKILLALLSILVTIGLYGLIVSANTVPEHEMNYKALIAKAERQGTVRVIVSLKMDSEHEGGPPLEAVEERHHKITAMQDAVLEALRLANAHVSSVKRYQFVPTLAMEVDKKALMVLIRIPEVASISEDIAVAPLTP